MDAKAVVAVLTFSVSSSGLLLINKLCLKEVPLPSFLAVLQFVASVLFAVGLSAIGQAELDKLEWPRVRVYMVYIGLFATAIYSNMQALSHSNVETLIVFRACGPLLVSVLERKPITLHEELVLNTVSAITNLSFYHQPLNAVLQHETVAALLVPLLLHDNHEAKLECAR